MRIRNLILSSIVKEKNYEQGKFTQRSIPGICTVCGKIAFFDEFGNGKCPHCSWEICKDEEKMGREQGIRYPMRRQNKAQTRTERASDG